MGLRRLELPARIFSTVRLSGRWPGLMISMRLSKMKSRMGAPDGGAHQIVAMHQGIDQQFFEHCLRDFGAPRCIDPTPSLHLVQVAHHEGQGVIEHFAQGPGKVLGIHILADMNGITRIADAVELRLGVEHPPQ